MPDFILEEMKRLRPISEFIDSMLSSFESDEKARAVILIWLTEIKVIPEIAPHLIRFDIVHLPCFYFGSQLGAVLEKIGVVLILTEKHYIGYHLANLIFDLVPDNRVTSTIRELQASRAIESFSHTS